jgi:endoglucanase
MKSCKLVDELLVNSNDASAVYFQNYIIHLIQRRALQQKPIKEEDMKSLLSKNSGLYLALLTSLCGISQSHYVQADTELVKNGSFYTLQGWQSKSVTLKHDTTGYSNCQHNGNNDEQCPQTGNKTFACLKSNNLSGIYASTYLQQSLSNVLQPNTRYRLSFKALRPVTATNLGPATLLSSIAANSSWPTPAKTYANWATLAPAVAFTANNTLLNNNSNYGSGFYLFAQAQSMEFVTPSVLPAGQDPTTINFTYIPTANNNDGICITDVSLQPTQTNAVNDAKVAVNNYAYLANAPKRATLSNLPVSATAWQLVSEFENITIVRKQAALPTLIQDNDSGDKLGIADFSDYTGTSIDPRFRVRVIDNKPHCDIGNYDGANCYIATPATPFIYNGNLYHNALIGANRCPLTIPGAGFDSANCFVAKPPAGTTPFIYNGNLYYTALPGKICPLNGSWYDGANCFVATPPAGTTPFIYDGNLYHSQLADFCPLKGSWFDGAHCFIAKVPAGNTPFIWSGNLYVKTNGIGNTIAQSELFRIGQKNLYNPLKKDALFSFYHQRSNEKIEPYVDGSDTNAFWKDTIGNLFHEAGTPTDTSISCFSGTDLHGNLWPGCDNRTFNVAKGWYDAADHGKYVVNGGISVWTLQNLAERLQSKGILNSAFPAGMMNFQSSHNSYSDLLTEARNEMEFMLSMQIPKSQGITMSVPVGYQAISATGLPTNNWTTTRPTQGVYQVRKLNGTKQYANNSVTGAISFNGGQLPSLEIALKLTSGVDVGGMVFHSVTDRCWTGIPTNPANYSVDCNGQDPINSRLYGPADIDKRVVSYPTSAATLNLAATAAQCYRVWKNVDAAFADRCLQASKDAWGAAVKIRRDYGDIFRYEYQNTDNTTGSWKNADNGSNLKTLEYGFALAPGFLGGGNYGDLRLRDEYYWAGMELYLATKDISYLKHADSFINTGALATDDKARGDYAQYSVSSQQGFPIYSYDWINGFNWQNVAALGSISALVADPATFKVDGQLTLPDLVGTRTSPLTNLLARARTIVDIQIERKVSGVPTASYKTPSNPYNVGDNNTNFPWGSNGEVLNRALILALAADYTTNANDKVEFRNGVTSAMNYLLGNNPLKRSYISGYGANALSNPHHRFFAKNASFGWATIPAGFIAGGPNTRDMASVEAGATRDANGNINDPSAYYFLNNTRKQCLVNPGSGVGAVYPMRCHTDYWLDFGSNEIAINWQAPLVWVSEFLSE